MQWLSASRNRSRRIYGLGISLFVVLAAFVAPSRSEAPAFVPYPEQRPELEHVAKIESFEIVSNGDIWIGTATGQSFVSRDGGNSWDEIRFTRGDDYGTGYESSDGLWQLKFFDDRHGIAGGYVPFQTGRSKDKREAIYRTEDGGKTWTLLPLPTTEPVTVIQTFKDGTGWLGTGWKNGNLLLTADFGKSWKYASVPYRPATGIKDLHFVSKATGVAATDYKIAYTNASGRIWQKMLPPKSPKENCQESKFKRVRLVGSGVIALHCGALYKRSLTESEWNRLAGSAGEISDFELIPDGLLAVNDKLEIITLSFRGDILDVKSGLLRSDPIYHSDSVLIAVRGKTIAVLDSTQRITVIDDMGIRSHRLFSTKPSNVWPEFMNWDRGPDGSLWGASSNFLYRSMDGGLSWQRLTVKGGLKVYRQGGIKVYHLG